MSFRFGVAVATGGVSVGPAELRWKAETGEAGVLAVPATAALSVADAGEVALTLPATARNRMLRFDLALVQGGATIARNEVTIALYAPRRTDDLPTVATPDIAIATFARGLGYRVMPADQAQITLVHALAPADIARLQGGARYVVLADGTQKTVGNLRTDPWRREQPFIPIVDDTPGLPASSEAQLPNINLIARHGTMWRGDWIAGFSWIRREGAYADVPGGPLVDLSFDRVIPHHVMTGFRAWEYGGPVHAGLVVGWAHKPAALIVERRVGHGGIVASTFRLLTEAPGADPVAAHLFDCLVRHAARLRTEA